MDKMAETIKGHGLDIEVWLTENTKYQCNCPECKGKNMYVLEAKGIVKAFEHVKPKHPGLRLRMTLSQGSTRAGVDKEIIELARDAGVGVSLYGDYTTYTPEHEPMIPPELEKFARGGGLADVFPTVTPDWWAVFPGAMPQFIRCRAQEFVEKELYAVTSYTVPDRRYYEFNMAALAEWTWNAKGRSPEAFARAYAIVTGIAEPELFSRWAIEQGRAAWILARTRLLTSISRHPKRGIYYPVIQRALDRLGEDAVPEAIDSARKAMDMAEKAGNDFIVAESAAVLGALESIPLLLEIEQIFEMYHPSIKESEVVQKRFAGKIEELKARALLVHKSLAEWDRIARGLEEPDIDSTARERERVRRPAYAVLKQVDLCLDRALEQIPDDSEIHGRLTDMKKSLPPIKW
jgi:hypothetical protein